VYNDEGGAPDLLVRPFRAFLFFFAGYQGDALAYINSRLRRCPIIVPGANHVPERCSRLVCFAPSGLGRAGGWTWSAKIPFSPSRRSAPIETSEVFKTSEVSGCGARSRWRGPPLRCRFFPNVGADPRACPREGAGITWADTRVRLYDLWTGRPRD